MWRRCWVVLVSEYSSCTTSKDGNAPVEFDFEARHGELEGVQVLERVEREAADGRGVGQRAEEVSERVGDAWIGAAAVDRNGHVLLRVAEEGEVCGAVGGEADEDLAGAWLGQYFGPRYIEYR